MKKKLLHVVGVRPNFMKVAPVMQALSSYEDVCQTLVHTGQYHDRNMSEVFLRKLSLPAPEVNLAVRSGSHLQQTATIMQRFEPFVLERKPDLVLVYGDVNSTIAAALVCSKVLFPVCYVERPPRIPPFFGPNRLVGAFWERVVNKLTILSHFRAVIIAAMRKPVE